MLTLRAPENCDAPSRAINAAMQEMESTLDDPYSAKGDRVSSLGETCLRPSRQTSRSAGSGVAHTTGRFAVVASVFVLALFVGIFYRQDLETAAAQTRGALTVAAASLSPHTVARKAELVALATTEQRPKGTGSELSGRGEVASRGVPATTNSVVATLAGVLLNSARDRWVELTVTPSANVKHLAQFTEWNHCGHSSTG